MLVLRMVPCRRKGVRTYAAGIGDDGVVETPRPGFLVRCTVFRCMAGVDYWLARHLVLPVLRVLFDYVTWPYAYAHMRMNYWFLRRYASDGKPIFDGITVEKNFSYGEHPLEFLDVISPTNAGVVHRGPMIYAHGGGWVCVNRELLMQSITPFVRAGYTVYVIDYPLAPENKFPVPLVSMLRALAWVKRRTGHDDVSLLGDSAGGNLVTMAAAMLSNPRLLRRFGRWAGSDVARWDYPRVEAVVSIYGVLDQEAHKERLPKSTWPCCAGWFYNAQISILNFCFFCYRPQDHGGPREGTEAAALLGSEAGSDIGIARMLTLSDVLQSGDIREYPPLLLVCGKHDPLARHAILVDKLMSNLNEQVQDKVISCELFLCNGLHSFHGMPIHLTCGRWKRESFVATRKIIEFFSSNEETVVMPKNLRVSFDFLLVLYFVVFVILTIQCGSFLLWLAQTGVNSAAHLMSGESFY